MIQELRKLQHRKFKELLGMYPEYIVKLAGQTGKQIHPVEVIGGELYVHADRYADFTRSLIHVCRNMIDHGIEAPESRALIGKDYRGRIRFEISADEQRIRLALFNDGEEIDLSAVRSRAVDQGICSEAQFDDMSADEQRKLIFHEGFTTKRSVSQLSGRGMGLSAVHKELEKLRGKVSVDSGPQGTTFIFELPLVV